MRGRKPRPLAPSLPMIFRSSKPSPPRRHLPWFQVQHARIVLAVAAGELFHAVASQMECDRATVWRLCRRYEQGGLTRLLWDEPRPGRPPGASPPRAARPDRPTGLPGANRPGAAYHPLDQPGPGPTGRRRWLHRVHQTAHRPANPPRRGLAAPPHPVLEDRPPRRPVQGAGRAGPLVLRQRGAVGPSGPLGGGRR